MPVSTTKEGREDFVNKELNAGALSLGPAGSTKTATATAGAATLDAPSGKVTSEAITTAAAAAYTLTVTCPTCQATDIVLVSVANGTNTQGVTSVSKVTPAAGSFVVIVHNLHASQALNGTIVVSYVIVRNV